MRKDREQSEEFVTKEELRQGGVLTHVLFIMIMDDVTKEIKAKIKQIYIEQKKSKTSRIAECIFADDLVVFTKNRSELRYNNVMEKVSRKRKGMEK